MPADMSGQLGKVVASARATFMEGQSRYKGTLGSDVEIYIYHTIKCRPLEWRVAQLQALLRCYDENEDLFAEALAKDLRKPRQEAVMFEVTIMVRISHGFVFRLSS